MATRTPRRVGTRHASRPANRTAAAASCAKVMFPWPTKRMPMVGEYPNTVFHSRCAPVTRSTRCSTTTVPRPTRTASTGRRRVASMHAERDQRGHADDERPVRAEPAVATEVQRARRGTWRRDIRGATARRTTSSPASHRRRHRSATAVRTVSPHATPTTTPIDAPMRLSRNSPSSLTLTRNSVRAASRAARVAGLHPAPLHVVGALEAEVGEHGRRHVGEVDEAVALRRGGTEETGREAGCRGPTRRSSASRLLGGFGPSTITMSERSVCSSSRPTRRSVVSSAWARIRDRLLVRCEARREVGAHEVGALDQHHRTGGPRVVEARAPRGRGRAGHRTVPRRRAATARVSTFPRGTLPSLVISAATAARRHGEDRVSGVLGSDPSPLATTPRAMPARASSSPSRPTLAP